MPSEHMESFTLIILALFFFFALQFGLKKKSKAAEVVFGVFCIINGISLPLLIFFLSFQSGHIYFPGRRTSSNLVSIDDPLFFIAIFIAFALSFFLIWLGISSFKQNRKR
jgi:hypothetical protein